MTNSVHPASNCARYDGDMFADDVLADSNGVFRMLRDLGDLVWLDRHQLYVVPRYDDLVRCLRADSVLISGQGVSANHSLNGDGAPTGTSTITSDGLHHRKLKALEMKLNRAGFAGGSNS